MDIYLNKINAFTQNGKVTINLQGSVVFKINKKKLGNSPKIICFRVTRRFQSNFIYSEYSICSPSISIYTCARFLQRIFYTFPRFPRFLSYFLTTVLYPLFRFLQYTALHCTPYSLSGLRNVRSLSICDVLQEDILESVLK